MSRSHFTFFQIPKSTLTPPMNRYYFTSKVTKSTIKQSDQEESSHIPWITQKRCVSTLFIYQSNGVWKFFSILTDQWKNPINTIESSQNTDFRTVFRIFIWIGCFNSLFLLLTSNQNFVKMIKSTLVSIRFIFGYAYVTYSNVSSYLTLPPTTI